MQLQHGIMRIQKLGLNTENTEKMTWVKIVCLIANGYFLSEYNIRIHSSHFVHLTSSLHHLTAADKGGGANILAAVGTARVRPVRYVVTVEQHFRL